MRHQASLWALGLVLASPGVALAAEEAPRTESTLKRYETRYVDEAMATASGWLHRHDLNRDGGIARDEAEVADEKLSIRVDEVKPGESGTRVIRVYRTYTGISGFDLIDANRDDRLSAKELAARVLLDGDANDDGQLGSWDYVLNGFPNLNDRHLRHRELLVASRSDEIEAPRLRPPDPSPATRPAPPR